MRRLAARLFAAALIAPIAPSAALAADEAPARITITGAGLAAAAPDLVTVTIGVETRAETAEAALAENNAKARALADAARAAGVAARDVQTSGLSLFPIYERRGASLAGGDGPPKLTGFQVGNALRLRLRDMATVGETLTALVAAGANQMRGIAFSIDDDQALRDEARRAAVADARRKAALYAEAAGVTLGPILSISETGAAGAPRFEAAARSLAADAVPVEAGETSVSAAVTIVWRIAD